MRFRLPHLPSSRRGWIRLGLCVCGLALVLACGSYAWYRHAQYMASPLATVDQLNKAIATQDLALFATIADPDALATDFAQAVASDMPEADIRQTTALAQLTMLAVLKEDNPPQPVRAATIPILPDHARAQMMQRPFTLELEPEPAALCVLEHPVLGEIPLRLGLTQDGEGWRVRQLVNAADLVHRYSSFVEEQERQRREVEMRQIEESREILARTFPDPICSAGVMRISGNVPLLSLSMSTGPNPGPQTVQAWGATLVLSSGDGTILARPQVMMYRMIEPGSNAMGSWSQDIDEEDYQRLAGAAPLSCAAQIDYAALNNGKIYSLAPDS